MGRLTALALALALVPGGLARAADTFDLQRKNVWKVDDIVTTTVHERDTQEMKFVPLDGVVAASTPPSDVVVEARLIERCVAIDAQSNRVRTLVYVVAWTAKDGAFHDTSLAGALLEVTGLGKDRVAHVVSSTQDLSKSASAWLSRRYGGGRPEPSAARAYWLPKAPVAVGDTWSADLSAFLDGTAAGARLDKSKTTSTCTLTSVAKSLALVTCQGGLALASFPGNEKGKPIPWKSGGTLLVTGTITVGLEGRVASATLALAQSLEGEAEMRGRTVKLTMTKNHRIEEVVGGEWPASVKMPEPATPAAPPPEPGMTGMGD